MSPKNKKKLNILRGKLDKLDDKLINIIKLRTNLVKEVVKLKEFKNEIVDKNRISIILKKIKKKSISKNIDPKITKNPVILEVFNSKPYPRSQNQCLISHNIWNE